MVRCRYDAWGKIDAVKDENGYDISSKALHIANINPFRYRGYYYDNETGLYYLQSRYYDPKVGRFVCGDETGLVRITDNTNLFRYCYNNPTNRVDYTGKIPLVIIELTKFIIKLKNGKYSKKESVYFQPKASDAKDLDLAFSVGHADNCTITVKKGNKILLSSKYKYTITIELSDKYDYEKFRPEEKGMIVSLINNVLGYYPMNWGIVKTYNWKINHTFNYYQ